MIPFCSPRTREPLVADGERLVSGSGEQYPIVRRIPRFVQEASYTASFGYEWNVHPRTQLDSATGVALSRERLERCLGGPVDELRGKSVLEAGAGAGRFTELLVGADALVHSIDLSAAVEANARNIGERTNFRLAQADLMAPPFPPDSFDVVLCLGVLQHTPSPEAAIESLWRMVKPGGLFVIDHYRWEISRVTKLAPLFRLVLKRLPPATAMRATDGLVSALFPVHWAVRRVRIVQALLSRVSPCLVYFRTYPDFSKDQHRELCRLDTFDSLTDTFKHLRTCGHIRRVLARLDATDIVVRKGGNGIEARCRRTHVAGSPAMAKRLG